MGWHWLIRLDMLKCRFLWYMICIHCVVCPPSEVTVYLPHPLPSGKHPIVVYVYDFLFYIPHMSEIIWFLAFSDLVHLAWYLQGPSMLLQMAVFLRKKEQSQRQHTTWLQIIPQSNDIQNSMILVEKQTYRTMEQNWEPRNKITCIWANNFWQRSQKHTMKKRKALP